MKKLILCLIIVLAAFAAFGCGDDQNEEKQAQKEQAEEQKAGGWEVNTEFEKASFPKAAAEAFSKYSDKIEDELVPVAYIGFREDEEDGAKAYEYIAYNKTLKKVQAVSVDTNAKGEPQIGNLQDFDFTEYTQGEGVPASATDEDGFSVPDDYAGTKIPKDIQSVFLSSAKTLDGNALTAIAYFGSQVVNGTNYALLCVGETVTADPVKNIQVVVVNRDSGGKCSVVNINTLDLESILQSDEDDEEEGDG